MKQIAQDFLEMMLENKGSYRHKEDEVFLMIEQLEEAGHAHEAARIFLAYVNLVMDKRHKIVLEADRPFLKLIRHIKRHLLNESICDGSSYIIRCITQTGIQSDHRYY